MEGVFREIIQKHHLNVKDYKELINCIPKCKLTNTDINNLITRLRTQNDSMHTNKILEAIVNILIKYNNIILSINSYLYIMEKIPKIVINNITILSKVGYHIIFCSDYMTATLDKKIIENILMMTDNKKISNDHYTQIFIGMCIASQRIGFKLKIPDDIIYNICILDKTSICNLKIIEYLNVYNYKLSNKDIIGIFKKCSENMIALILQGFNHKITTSQVHIILDIHRNNIKISTIDKHIFNNNINIFSKLPPLSHAKKISYIIKICQKYGYEIDINEIIYICNMGYYINDISQIGISIEDILKIQDRVLWFPYIISKNNVLSINKLLYYSQQVFSKNDIMLFIKNTNIYPNIYCLRVITLNHGNNVITNYVKETYKLEYDMICLLYILYCYDIPSSNKTINSYINSVNNDQLFKIKEIYMEKKNDNINEKKNEILIDEKKDKKIIINKKRELPLLDTVKNKFKISKDINFIEMRRLIMKYIKMNNLQNSDNIVLDDFLTVIYNNMNNTINITYIDDLVYKCFK